MQLEIANIGGVVSGSIEIDEGANVVQGTNFTGKSSIMRGIETVMGTSNLDRKEQPLMETADSGHAKIRKSESNEVRVSLSREDGAISVAGRPYIRNERSRMLAHLFCFLGEQNPVRQAVETRDNRLLTELLQRPLDMEDIDSKIDEKQSQRVEIQDELESVEAKADRRSELQEKVTRLESELEELRSEKSEVEAELAETESIDEDLREELSEKRTRKSNFETKVERLEREKETLESKLAEKREELAGVEVPEEPDVESDVHAKRERLEELDLQIDLLDDLYRVNNEVVEEEQAGLVSDIDRSIEGDEIVCWVCGEEHDQSHIEQRVELLKEKRQELNREQVRINSEIDEIQKRRDKYEAAVDLSDRLEDEIETLQGRISSKANDIEKAKETLQSVADDVEALKAERVESDSNELEDRLADIEREIGSTENDLEDARSSLEAAVDAADRVESLRAKLQGIRGQLKKLRKRKTETQDELAEQFSEILSDIIDRFGTGFDGGRLDVIRNDDETLDRYELVVARDGREAELANLSEGETALVGFAVALAGYHAFDVGNRVSLMFVDSVGELSAENLHALLNYIDSECEPDYLISTAYPEAGEFEANMITPDLWTAVSDGDSRATAD